MDPVDGVVTVEGVLDEVAVVGMVVIAVDISVEVKMVAGYVGVCEVVVANEGRVVVFNVVVGFLVVVELGVGMLVVVET